MATKTVTTTKYFDDVSGDELAEDDVVTLRFGFDGVEYEIDLSSDNADAMRAVFEPYLEKARKVSVRRGGPTTRQSSSSSGGSRDLAAARAWLRKNGYTVADRGRIPQNLLDAFHAGAR